VLSAFRIEKRNKKGSKFSGLLPTSSLITDLKKCLAASPQAQVGGAYIPAFAKPIFR
jgi:hypothetical protein